MRGILERSELPHSFIPEPTTRGRSHHTRGLASGIGRPVISSSSRGNEGCGRAHTCARPRHAAAPLHRPATRETLLCGLGFIPEGLNAAEFEKRDSWQVIRGKLVEQPAPSVFEEVGFRSSVQRARSIPRFR